MIFKERRVTTKLPNLSPASISVCTYLASVYNFLCIVCGIMLSVRTQWWDHFQSLCLLVCIYVLYVCGVMLSVRHPRWGLLPVSPCISVYICCVHVWWYMMLSVGTQDGTITTLCVCISVYICSVCVWCNVVGKDPRWDHYHFLGALVCISVVYVCGIMLLVRTQDGDHYLVSVCVLVCIYLFCMCVV